MKFSITFQIGDEVFTPQEMGRFMRMVLGDPVKAPEGDAEPSSPAPGTPTKAERENRSEALAFYAYCLECDTEWTTAESFRSDRDSTLRMVFNGRPQSELDAALSRRLSEETVCPDCTHDLWVTPRSDG